MFRPRRWQNEFQLDENTPWELSDMPERMGHLAHTVVSEGLKGANDEMVFDRVAAEGKILATQDLKLAALARFGGGNC